MIRKKVFINSKEHKPPVLHLSSQNDDMILSRCPHEKNKHHWPVTPLYNGDDVTRALISPSTALAARNSAYNLRMSETNNSNYYLHRALYVPQALQSSVIPYSKLGMLIRVSPPSVLEANGSVLTRAENRIPKTLSVFSP